MSNVTCSECGAELIGAVNRCWKCGQEVLTRAGDSSLPPVRRGPLDEEQILVAQLADERPAEQPVEIRRVGSPFASDAELTPLPGRPIQPFARPRPPRDASVYGAALSVAMGVMGLIVGYWSWLAGLPATIGIVVGFWGLRSERRGMAWIGLTLCVLAIAVGLVKRYESLYGRQLW